MEPLWYALGAGSCIDACRPAWYPLVPGCSPRGEGGLDTSPYVAEEEAAAVDLQNNQDWLKKSFKDLHGGSVLV